MQSSVNGEKERENIGTGFFVRESILLHFVAFFHVASLFSTEVGNEKALELDNRIYFHISA